MILPFLVVYLQFIKLVTHKAISSLSVVVVLADNELHDKGDILGLLLAQHLLCMLVVVVLLVLYQVVHLVEIVPDLVLEVHTHRLDLVPHRVLLTNPRHPRYVQVFWSHFLLLSEHHLLRVFPLYAPLHIPK